VVFAQETAQVAFGGVFQHQCRPNSPIPPKCRAPSVRPCPVPLQNRHCRHALGENAVDVNNALVVAHRLKQVSFSEQADGQGALERRTHVRAFTHTDTTKTESQQISRQTWAAQQRRELALGSATFSAFTATYSWPRAAS
jgi:hypothetical protein